MKIMFVFILLVWCVDSTLAETECSFSAATASRECRVQVYSVYSASLASADRARNIKIVCSHEQADQPVIEQNQFSQSHNLSSLEIERCEQLQIRRGAFQGLSNLSTLKLTGNAPCLRTLKHLDLSYNQLRSLPARAFPHLASLQQLSLEGNQLNSLEDDSFSGLASLEMINLSENHLSALPPAVWDDTPHLQQIFLQNNHLSVLSPRIFARVHAVQILNLARNQLIMLQQEIFLNLSTLETLQLDENQLTDINGLLTAQNQLRWLNVSSNKLQWFDYAFIPNSLEMIDLRHNQIEELGNYYQLKDGFSLKTMDASSNKIRKLSPSAFLASLENINLNSNHIEEISANTFMQMDNLSRVEIKQNSLVTLQLAALALQPREHSDSAPKFYLGSNPFLCDCEMDYLTKMSQLSLSGHYPHIMDLDKISCNIISHINSGAPYLLQPLLETSASQFLCQYQAHCFALCQCCHFFACDCRMQCPAGCTCYHDSAWRQNVIECSTRDHLGVPPLIPMDANVIYLDGNNFRNFLQQAFIGRSKVRSLFLNSSKIIAIGKKTFNGLSELEILHLEDNLLEEIAGGEFANLTSLQQLYLHGNRIFHIDQEAFAYLSNLQVLSLSGNHLSVFPVWKLYSLPKLSSISVSGNPWTCDCSFVQKLQQFVAGLPGMDTTQLECTGQESRVNIGANITCQNSVAVPVSQTVAADHRHSLVLITAIMLGVCLVTVTSSCLVFVFRTSLKVWLHSCYGVRLRGEAGESKDTLYHAFVSYSVRDEEFMQKIFLPHLDTCDTSYRLCLQHRDFPPGTATTETWAATQAWCARVVLVVSPAFLTTEWGQVQVLVQGTKTPVIVLIEELTSLDLAAVPQFRHLLGTSIVIKWNDPGFWKKLRYHLPDGRKHAREGRSSLHKPGPAHRGVEWHYDSVGQTYIDSSASTHSTMPGSASPRSHVLQTRPGIRHTGVINPLEQWSDIYDCDHLYQTLDPVHHHAGEGDMLEVMLPGGEVVAATLVRHPTGKIIPLVLASEQ